MVMVDGSEADFSYLDSVADDGGPFVAFPSRVSVSSLLPGATVLA